MQKVKFTYWPIKGYGEYVRISLAYLGIDYEEVNVTGEEWTKQKAELTAQNAFFPNLPNVQDGDLFLTESLVIPKYYARKLGRTELLASEDPLLASRFEQVQGVLEDIKSALMKGFFTDSWKEAMESNVQEGSNMQTKLKQISVYLGENDFLVGNQFTLVDIYAAYTFYFLRTALQGAGVTDLVEQNANLAKLQDRVFEQPGIKEYVQSDVFVNRPLSFPHAARWLKN